MSALQRLGQVSAEYARMAQAYEEVAIAAADAESAHKRERAKAILRAKSDDSTRMSHAEAEARAEADDHVSGLYAARLRAAAVADAHRERLRQLREQVAVGRSFASAEKEGDRLHATGGGP